MGIEYIIVNRDKKEILDFDKLGFGTKIGAITSGTISSFLTWLLVNPHGYGDDLPEMMGRWAGDRIEIIGDADEERYDEVRSNFKDVTVQAITAFAKEMPFERITQLQPMGLIDKAGAVVIDSRNRESVAKYWKEAEEAESVELKRYLQEEDKLEQALRNGTATEVRALHCPLSKGALHVKYFEPRSEPPFIVAKGIASDFVARISKLPNRPPWVDSLGYEFTTET